jgi:YbbR domain-containing protein
MDLRRIFLENWPIKLASLLLAVSLWFYVTSKGKTEMSLTVPLELRNIPRGMAVVGDVPGAVEARLQGQERALREIAAGKKVVGAVDLSLAKEGENSIRISSDDIQKPSGVTVTHLSPYEIVVNLDRIIRTTIRLRPVLTGTPARGYRLGTVSVTPPRITLEGPQGSVRAFTSLQTLPIEIAGMKEPVTVEPRIDYQGKPVKIIEQDIHVHIGIQKERP